LRAGDPDRAPRPVELRASFLRRIDADGRPIECRATIVHRGRRLVAGRCEVYDHRGRVAVEVELTYLFE
jgi:acyl-coenzyme A thioesterase PaaI-like protein